MGIAWAFSQKVLGVAGMKRVSGIPLSVHCGLEYLPHPSLAVRVGAYSAPFRHYGGLGLMWGYFRLDMAISSTIQIVLTTQISMGTGHIKNLCGYCFKKDLGEDVHK